MIRFDLLPDMMQRYESRLAKFAPEYAWIRENLPAGARVLSESDPLLYLNTGRHAVGSTVIVPTIYWYREDRAARVQAFLDAVPYAASQGAEYFFLSPEDYVRDFSAEDHVEIQKRLRANADMTLLHEGAGASIYRLNQRK
jgi:hypothetical protein